MTTIEQIRQMLIMADIEPALYQGRLRDSCVEGWFDLSAQEMGAMKMSDPCGHYEFRALYCFEEPE